MIHWENRNEVGRFFVNEPMGWAYEYAFICYCYVDNVIMKQRGDMNTFPGATVAICFARFKRSVVDRGD